MFDDGRTLAYGTMGGEGQPQTQAATFSRHALFGQDLQAAVDAPRWLLGRTWGEDSVTLKLEDRFDPVVVQALRDAGHDVELVAPMTSLMGHAGALQGAFDPRSDGAVGAVICSASQHVGWHAQVGRRYPVWSGTRFGVIAAPSRFPGSAWERSSPLTGRTAMTAAFC